MSFWLNLPQIVSDYLFFSIQAEGAALLRNTPFFWPRKRGKESEF